MSDVDVVTGAFGYTGRYIAGRLLESGRNVKTLTGHPDRPNPFGDRIDVAPLDFEERRALTEHLRGATTLYNIGCGSHAATSPSSGPSPTARPSSERQEMPACDGSCT